MTEMQNMSFKETKGCMFKFVGDVKIFKICKKPNEE